MRELRYLALGSSQATGPAFQLLSLGWLWALPFFLPYLLYWYLVYRRWQWYRAAAAD